MRMKNALKKIIFLSLIPALIFSCKNDKETGDSGSGWFSDEIENPATAEGIAAVLKNNEDFKLFGEEEILKFYRSRNNEPLWNDEDIREELLTELKNADREGLFFQDYHGKRIHKIITSEDISEEKSAEADILLTDAFLKYANHLYYGKLNPKELYEIWGITRDSINEISILKEAFEEEDISAFLEKLKPNQSIYAGLKESLAEYKKLAEQEEEVIKIPKGEVIKPNDKDGRISVITERLKQLNVLDEDYEMDSLFYHEDLQKAVVKFQKENGLATDKILGNSTIQELNMGATQRYNQILANLERWRWYPRDLGEHYILVNIPDFHLAVVKNKDTLRIHDVIAGEVNNQTPVFSDSISYIVLNPEWHIPVSIRNNEIIPAAASNPNYLQSRNIYATGPDGLRIDPSSINWSGEEVYSYSFTQGAGPSNSLGRLKIIYPNKYAIYLHDTPAKSLFSRNARAESHGCVRVEDATHLAAYLLSNREDWDLEKIQKTIASGITKKVEVTQPVKVHHFYWTAWRNNGETQFTNDVYQLDKEIYTRLIPD